MPVQGTLCLRCFLRLWKNNRVSEVTSTRTFGNNKSERFRDEYDSVYLHRSCLRDRCYTTNVKVNNDTCYCVPRLCNRGEAISDWFDRRLPKVQGVVVVVVDPLCISHFCILMIQYH